MRKITYSNKLTKNTGNYENENPMFSETLELENPTEEEVSKEYLVMKQRVDGMLMGYTSITQVLEKPHYSEHNGKMYPSVTAITSQTTNFAKIPNIQMYADEGTRVHSLIENQIKSKKFEEIEGYKWLKCKDQIKDLFDKEVLLEERFWCEKPLYTGKPDMLVFDNGLVAVVDFKSGEFKEDYLMQLSAYANANGGNENTKLIVCELKTGKVYSFTNDKEYYQRFDLLRRVYIARYEK